MYALQNNGRTGERSILEKYIHPLVSAGFNVLAFDERNHGQSEYAPPITFGYYESHDIPTMIDWLLSMWLHSHWLSGTKPDMYWPTMTKWPIWWLIELQLFKAIH